jgi:hypothetical protein
MGPEARLQKSIVDFVRYVAPDVLIFAVPNGGYRRPAEAGILNATGVVAGIPDLCVILPCGLVRFLEVKADGGSLSRNQRAILDRLMSMQVPYAVVRSIEDVRTAFQHWRIPTRETGA